jgi:hypothetical protein
LWVAVNTLINLCGFRKDEKVIESLCHFQPLNKEPDPCSCLVESDVFNSIYDVFSVGSVAVFI